MKLGKPGWLPNLLMQVTTVQPAAVGVVGAGSKSSTSARAQARGLLARRLADRTILYPSLQNAPQDEADLSLSAQRFHAQLRALSTLALDVAAVCAHAGDAPRREQLLLLFAAWTGEFGVARSLEGLVKSKKPPPRKLWNGVQVALEERAEASSGDAVHGVLLHNGALEVDAHLFGRLAVDYFARGFFHAPSAERRVLGAARYKGMLLEVLSTLASVEHPPSSAAQRAIVKQLRGLGLPPKTSKLFKQRLERRFQGGKDAVSAQELLRPVRGSQIQRWLLDQALLASLAQGQRSEKEQAFLSELAATMGVDRETLQNREREVASFYETHRAQVDGFTEVGEPGRTSKIMVSMQGRMVKTFRRLMQEVRETGELSVLIGRLARGYSPTADERRRMREQLLDLAKAVPALALFAAPGGLFLLMALAKVLPFSLLPSAFRDEPDARRKL